MTIMTVLPKVPGGDGPGSSLGAQHRVDVHRDGRPGHPKRAPGDAELPLVDRRTGVDQQPVGGLLDSRFERKRDAAASRRELPVDVDGAIAAGPDRGRAKAHLWVAVDVEEVGRAQVPVAAAVALFPPMQTTMDDAATGLGIVNNL